jgi:hypothetical protein
MPAGRPTELIAEVLEAVLRLLPTCMYPRRSRGSLQWSGVDADQDVASLSEC